MLTGNQHLRQHGEVVNIGYVVGNLSIDILQLEQSTVKRNCEVTEVTDMASSFVYFTTNLVMIHTGFLATAESFET